VADRYVAAINVRRWPQPEAIHDRRNRW